MEEKMNGVTTNSNGVLNRVSFASCHLNRLDSSARPTEPRLPAGGRGRNDNRGSILIVALWVLIFFTGIVAVLAARVQSEIGVVRRMTEAVSARASAYSGIAYVQEFIKKEEDSTSPAALPSTSSFWINNPKFFKEVELNPLAKKSFSVGYYDVGEKGEQGEFIFGLQDEESKLNINKVSEAVLTRFFQGCDESLGDHAAELAKEVIKWRERTGEFKEFGSKDGSIKEGFGSLEELLMVPGMNEPLWQIAKKNLTVFGAGKVNMNTVSRDMLVCLGISSTLADRIVEYRNFTRDQIKANPASTEEPISDLGQLEQKIRVTPEEDKQLQNVSPIWTYTSDTFHFITLANGSSQGHGAGYECIVNRKGEILFLRDY